MNTEIIARGLIIKKGKLLAAYYKKGKFYFLPGGHIEDGEFLENALVRELKEETDTNFEVGDLIGVYENKFDDEGTRRKEITVLFEIDSKESDPDVQISSMEDHLEFRWLDENRLKEVCFLPANIKEVVGNKLKDGTFSTYDCEENG